ncbi:TetR/AcrR family transcriptional regulator [Nocardioides pocheonensis]|uniref:TetR/AcrR family transcriptional regulator n=1 Tax=Nocardioides pocheonensis TaxID=661485 RepID=UPI001611DA36|nr:TetR/AcrR family transcriptional regulator [Nocardioides pocheonensis]
MTTDIRPLRADAQRNLERILASARALFAERGPAAQMEDIAAHAGVGVGTLYRRFPTKEALVTALVRERFQQFGLIAAECERIEDPYDALATMMRRHAESTEGDVAFQLAMLKLNDFHWEGIEQDKAALNAVVSRIIERAQAADQVRADLAVEDYGMMMCGVTATMHFMSERHEWRRHLDLILAGLKPS